MKRILVVIDYSESFGGGFTYALNMIKFMNDLSNRKLDIEFLFAPTSNETESILSENHILGLIDDLLIYRSSGLRYTFLRNCMKIGEKFRGKKNLINTVKKYSIDTIYFLTPSDIAKECQNVPFIFTLWDLCHRDWPNQFSEINSKTFFEREKLYNEVLRKAVLIVVDSDDLVKKTVDYYKVDIEKIFKIPFLMPSAENIKVNDGVIEKYNLKSPFIFYPAQFWEHKNHKYIIEALSILKRKQGVQINAVFCGRDFGSLKSLEKLAEEKEIKEQIKFLGFIPKEDVWGLYKYALALVMPTYFGPTNIPPLEALSIGCPVIYSDFPSFRKEFEGMTQFVNLENPEELAQYVQSVAYYADVA